MPPSGGPESPESELAGLAARRDALQQAAGLPGAQTQPLLDAAFAELDGAIDALTAMQAQNAARRAAGSACRSANATDSSVMRCGPAS